MYVCVFLRLRVIKKRRWRGVQEERKKQEIKDEGHFIGLMTLGDTVTKSGIQRTGGVVWGWGGEMCKPRGKVSNAAVWRPMHVLNRPALVSKLLFYVKTVYV